jgi:porin
VAAAFNGDAFENASRGRGESPAESEVALEWTYRAGVTEWLSLQGDLQYIVNPGGLRDRPDAIVAGFRFVVDL